MARNDVLARLAVLITANNAEFGAVMSQSSSQAKAFQNAINGLNGTLKTIGIGFGIKQVIDGIKDAIGTAAQFEHTMSTVKAITGEAGEGFRELEENAKSLGRSTQFTADQVGQLQVAYGRLGFTKKEIIDATAATLDLAAATGEDLAKAADVAGSVVRGFALNANQTQRVVDVMASSFNRTALGLENFSEAIKYVAPIAASANITIEETTALLGTLADAGIRGSQAGTSLRKIITDLDHGSGSLSEKLKALADKGLTGAEAMSEVGRTAYASLLILAKNTEKTDAAAKAYQNVAGEAKAAANIINDNLTGDVIKLTSAWDGLIISLGKTGLLRDAVQGIRSVILDLQGLSNESVIFERAVLKIKGGISSLGAVGLDNAINDLKAYRAEIGRPIDIKEFNTLIEEYHLTEKQVNELKNAIDDVNKSLSFNESELQKFNAFAKANGYTDLKKAADDYIETINKQIIVETNLQQQRKQQISDTGSSIFLDNSGKINDLLKIIDLVKQVGVEVAKIPEVPAPKAGLIQAAEERLKEFKKSKDEAFTIESIRYFDNLIQETEAELKRLNESLPFNNRRTEALPTNISTEVPSLSGQQFLIDSGASENAVSSLNDTAKALDNLNLAYTNNKASQAAWRQAYAENLKEVKKQTLDLAPIIAQGLTSFADALGQAAAGVGNFGDNILKSIAGFMRSFGEQLIALGTGAVAAKLIIKYPYAAIAAGIALVAIAGAASAAASNAQSGINGSGGAGGFQSGTTSQFVTSRQTMQLELTGKFNISGNDLALTLSNQNIRDQRIKPG